PEPLDWPVGRLAAPGSAQPNQECVEIRKDRRQNAAHRRFAVSDKPPGIRAVPPAKSAPAKEPDRPRQLPAPNLPSLGTSLYGRFRPRSVGWKDAAVLADCSVGAHRRRYAAPDCEPVPPPMGRPATAPVRDKPHRDTRELPA